MRLPRYDPGMTGNEKSDAELKLVVDLMRDFSRQTDPQVAGRIYTAGMRKGLLPADEWLSVSRRGLEAPAYRITRSTTWKEEINPWKQPEQLPMFTRGLLGELIYSEEPALITDLRDRLSDDDPAAEYLRGFQMLATLPQYDDGVALNMGVMLLRDPSQFPVERYPAMVWQGNLYGRALYNMLLRNELKLAYDKLDAELRSVGDIQRSLLPTELPQIDTLDLAAFYETSTRAGGDYYDLFDLHDGRRWGILIADVSGHSTPAAVVMAITHAVAHLHPGAGSPPGELLTFVNRQLARRYTNNGTFVTAFYGEYDAQARTLTYASAGHNPPRLLRRGSCEVEALDGVGGLPLGIEDDETYHERTVVLAPGDRMIFYTDGITEARDPAGMLFGDDRLDESFLCAAQTAEELKDRVLSRVRSFTGPRTPADDQTLLAAVVR